MRLGGHDSLMLQSGKWIAPRPRESLMGHRSVAQSANSKGLYHLYLVIVLQLIFLYVTQVVHFISLNAVGA